MMMHPESNKSFKTISLALCLIALLLAASIGFSQRVVAMSSTAFAYIAMPYKPDSSPQPVVLYRGDAHRTGAYDVPGIRAMTRVKWQLPVGEITHAPPVFANGIIYLMSSNGRLAAIDSATGSTIWSFKAKPATPLFSSVAVAEGVVYVAQYKRLYALNAQTGEKLWKFKTKDLALPGPLVVGSTIYFCCFDNNLYAVNTSTGKKRWKLDIGDSDTPPVYDNGIVYVSSLDSASNQSNLLAVDSETGQERWRIQRPASIAWANGIAISEGLLYIASNDGRLYGINIETRDVVWSYQGGASGWSRPAVANGVVYIGNQDQYLHALNSTTGELLWKFKAEAAVMADPIVAGGVVYFGVVNLQDTPTPRPFYAVDARTGEELWKFQADGRVIASAAIGDGAIYFATNFGSTGTLYALE
ncbi:MAG: PQQ-binding-like beta-propeller repeat protein [Blastocatellia bacterium]